MHLGTVSFAAGIFLLQQQPELPAPRLLWIALIWLAVLLVGALCLTRQGGVRRFICVAASGVGGFLFAAWVAHHRLADALPPVWEGRDIVIVGVVATMPQADRRRVRFELDVEKTMTPFASVPRRVVLSWWGAGRIQHASGRNSFPRAGERWRLKVRLRRPHGTANPHGFDYEAWLLERGLRATGYVRREATNRRLAPLVHRPQYWIERARELARGRILDALPDARYAGVIAALVIGDQRAISREQWQLFTRTGINHLMSISGLHVTMVSGLVFALVCALWRRSGLTQRVPAFKAATAASLVAAYGYALLSGFAVPAQRTVFMLTVVAIALWIGAIESPASVLAAAVLVVLLLDPWAVLAPGFWLSFGAVATIMYITSGRIGRSHWIAAFGRVQIAVTLALIPLLLVLFQKVSIISPLANAFAIPVVSLLVVPMSLLGTVLPFDVLLSMAHVTLSGCLSLLEYLGELPAAVWVQRAPPSWTVVVALGAMFLLLAPRGLPGRWLGVLGLVPLFAAGPSPLNTGALQISVLDVGHGVAVVVRTASHVLLYDTGPSFGPDADSGSRIIVPYLRASGVRRLDAVVLSHDDDDHTGGAISVLQEIPSQVLMTSLPENHRAVRMHRSNVRCAAGQQWDWDGVHFEMIYPAERSYADLRIRDNDRSCVLKIESAGLRVLLPGDIERRAEQALVISHAARLRADVLIAPHQGSKTSSSADLIGAVQPRVVIFPVGYRNRFRHPHGEVLKRFVDQGAVIFRTDRDGALLIDSAPNVPYRITAYRAVYRRYWHTPPPDSAPDLMH